MKTVKILTEKPPEWDSLVSHPLESWSWGEFRKKMGVDVVRLGVYHKHELSGGWQISFHSLPKLPFTIGYFPKGPLPNQIMSEELVNLGRKKNAIFIQLEPNITSSYLLAPISYLRPSHHPLFTKYTFILDLTQSEEELLAGMHHKTRYNIRLAAKRGVKIREESTPQAFEAYLQLSEETTERQGFYAHSTAYHRTMWETLHPEGIAKLWTARFQNKVLAAWILFLWQDTIYYPYGASSREDRDVMAPNLLLWEIAKWGKKSGFKNFDLWGALGQSPDPSDPWYGFHRFKEGYHPKLVEFAGSFDLVINPVLYPLYCIADTLRWQILKKRKR